MKLKLYLLLFFAHLLLISCSDLKATEISNPTKFSHKTETLKVKVTNVIFGNFNKELYANGRASAKQKADITFTLDEKIAAVYVKNGQTVKLNQILAKQDKEKYLDALIKAREQFEKSKIDVEDVLLGFGYSVKDSLTKKIPNKILEIAKNRANYNSTLVEYKDAKRNLNSTELRAPFDGVVANVSSKKYTYPDKSTPFCTLINNKVLEIEFPILESNYSLVSKGQEILISTINDSNNLKGFISEINPTVDENGMIKVKGIVSNSSGNLLDGMNVKIIINKSIPNSLFVPRESVVVRDGKKVVFSYKEGKALWNYVETSYENSKYIVITKGLNKNDRIIYSNNSNLAHKSDVEIDLIND